MGVVDSDQRIQGQDQGRAWASRPRWVDPAIVGATTFAVCVVGVSRSAWSGDEAATVVILRRTGEQFWAAVRNDLAVGPYYVMMKPLAMLSSSPLALRLPSVAAMSAAAVVLFVLVRHVAGLVLATYSVVALMLLPAVSRYGQDARPYAFAVLGVTLVVWCWWRFLEGGGIGWGVAYTGSVVLTGLMHAYALLTCVALLMVAALRPRRFRSTALRRTLAPATIAAVLLGAFLFPLAGSVLGQPDPPPVSGVNVAEELARLPMGVLQPRFAVTAAGLLLLLGFIGVLALSRRRFACSPGFEFVPILWVLVPPAILVTLQWVSSHPGLVARYWVICLPALAIGVAVALTCPGKAPWMPVLAFTAIALLAAPTQVAIRGPDGHLGQRWVRLAQVLGEPIVGDLPLLIQGFSQRGLSANAPDLPPERTPLNGDPGPSGRISSIPYGAGSEEYQRLLQTHDRVLIYQQRRGGADSLPDAGDFTQTEDVRGTFSEPVVLCQWFGDALGLFATPDATPDPKWAVRAAATLEGVDPTRIECLSTS